MAALRTPVILSGTSLSKEAGSSSLVNAKLDKLRRPCLLVFLGGVASQPHLLSLPDSLLLEPLSMDAWLERLLELSLLPTLEPLLPPVDCHSLNSYSALSAWVSLKQFHARWSFLHVQYSLINKGLLPTASSSSLWWEICMMEESINDGSPQLKS